jgi:hypothetical protein
VSWECDCGTNCWVDWFEFGYVGMGRYKYGYWMVFALYLFVYIRMSHKIHRACGHFGIFVDKDLVSHPALNYVGFTLAVISVVFYFPVKV